MDPSKRHLQFLLENDMDYNATPDPDQDKFSMQELLANIYTPGPSFQFILDFDRHSPEQVSQSVYPILSVRPDSLTQAALVDRIHPEDLDFYSHCVEIIPGFLSREIDPQDWPYYKASFQYRMNVGTDYRLFLHQVTPIPTADKSRHGPGILKKAFVSLSDISHITGLNHRKLSMIGMDGRPSFFNVGSHHEFYEFQPRENNYSDREIEVLQLVAEGLSNEDIARSLLISDGTVRTHRRNILAKSHSANSVQVVADAIRKGWI